MATTERTIDIRPFEVEISEEVLADLRRRIAATQWPEKETVADSSQGVPLAPMQELARYWATDYDWRKVEAQLQALPQFKTEIDGLDIHFIHVKSSHEDALPLIVNHGWPGSIIEQLKIIGPLTDPTAHGGSAADAFDVVIPSMPGYGFSGKPTSTGWGPERMGRAWAELMKRIGSDSFVAQGGDWGAFIVDLMGVQEVPGWSPSTPTIREPFQLRSTRRLRPARPRQLDCQPRRDAPMRVWSSPTSRSPTRSSWGLARKPCMASQIHPSGWPLGFSTTATVTANRPWGSSRSRPNDQRYRRADA
jgi:Epoxide hydrolase N terminus